MDEAARNAVAAATDARLSSSAAEDRFSGAVLVRVGGSVVLKAGYGLADRDAGIANTPETRFRIGSLNKMFTAVAVMQQVGLSRLSLQTTVGQALPDYPDREVAATVTADHLLSHTSGLGDIWGEDFDRERLRLRNPADYVDLFGNRGLLAEPGTGFRYSSYGYVLLGRMLEAVTGQDYDSLVRTGVFEPAGMGATGSLPEEVEVPGRAAGYRRTPEGWRNAGDTLPWRGTPAGGGYSTVKDLGRFATALAGCRLLDEPKTELMTRGRWAAEGGFSYGYGFMEDVDRGLRRIGHTGGASGMAAIFWMYPEKDWLIVVLSNRDPPAARMVADSIAGRLHEAEGTPA